MEIKIISPPHHFEAAGVFKDIKSVYVINGKVKRYNYFCCVGNSFCISEIYRIFLLNDILYYPPQHSFNLPFWSKR